MNTRGMMNKKSILKLSVFGILVFLLVALFVFVFYSSISQALVEKNYGFGENVKIDLKGIEDFEMKIKTPSETFIKKGSDEVVVFKPKENGNYEVVVSYEGKREVYSFSVGEKQETKVNEEQSGEGDVSEAPQDLTAPEELPTDKIEKKISLSSDASGNYDKEVKINNDFIFEFDNSENVDFRDVKADYVSEEEGLFYIFSFGEGIPVKSVRTDGSKTYVELEKSRSLKPGIYKIRFITDSGNFEKEFAYGLISTNTKKSIYKPGETADFQIVVLDSKGVGVCSPNILFSIFSSSGEKLSVERNQIFFRECGLFETSQIVNEEGIYKIEAETIVDGYKVRFDSEFLVAKDYDYEIVREAESKIDPTIENNFKVVLNVESLKGESKLEIKEYVPSVFEVQTDAVVEIDGDTKILTWNVDSGKAKLEYIYSVPMAWPYLYELGKIKVNDFEEFRNWFVAVDPIIPVTNNSGQDVAIIGMGNNTFVVGWIPPGLNLVNVQAFDTNGTNLTGRVDVSLLNTKPTSRVALGAVSQTEFLVGWTNNGSGGTDDFRLASYNWSDMSQNWFDQVDGNIGSDAAAFHDVGSVASMGDRWVACMIEDGEGDADMYTATFAAPTTATETNVDGGANPDSPLTNQVECAILNSTRVAYVWFDDSGDTISYSIRDQTGAQIIVQTTIAGGGTTGQVATTALNQNAFVVAYSNTSNVVGISIRDRNNNVVLAPTVIDINAGTNPRLSIATVKNRTANEEWFVVAWNDRNAGAIQARVYNSTGSLKYGTYNLATDENETNLLFDIYGKDSFTNVGLCDEIFALAYVNDSNGVIVKLLDLGGNEWDGICDYENPLVDVVLPLNITRTDPNVNFIINVQDSSSVSAYYTLNGGIHNFSMSSENGISYNATNTSIADGSYTVRYYVTDIKGNLNNSQSVTFAINTTMPDSISPAVLINFPLNITYYAVYDLPFTFSVNLNENGSVMYSLDGGFNNISMTGQEGAFGTVFSDINSSIAIGDYKFSVYANDTNGNRNYSESVNFSLVQENIILNGTILDAEGNFINTTLIVYDESSNDTVYNDTGISQETILPLDSTYTVEVHPLDITNVEKIEFNNVDFSAENQVITRIVKVDEFNYSNSSQIFAIESRLENFSNGTVTFTASYNSLLKCSDWVFDNRTCIGNWEEFITDLVPGSSYDFSIEEEEEEQGFMMIEITNALHLDENRTYISNIFNEVIAPDGVWSETIPEQHYVRITFEVNLTSQNDITVFPRNISGDPKIEVYEKDGIIKLAEFSPLLSNQYNKIFLTNLSGNQSTFDLKIIEGDVQFDHIIDPQSSSYVDGTATGSISTIAGAPTTVATLVPGFPLGDNLVLAAVQVLSTDAGAENVVAGALDLNRVGGSTLATNEFAVQVSTANLNNNYFILALDSGAPLNSQYAVTAYSSATAVDTEAKIVALQGLSFVNVSDSGSVAVGTGDTQIVVATGPPTVGNNVVVASIQIDNGGTAQDIAAGGIDLRNGATSLTSNQYAMSFANAAPTDIQNIVLLAYDTGAAANSVYNVTALAANSANAEVKLAVFRVTDAAFVDSGSTAIATSATSLASLSTSFPGNSTIVAIGAVQVNDGDTNVETLAADTGLLLTENHVAKSANDLIMSAFAASGSAGDGIRHTLLWRNSTYAANSIYNISATASAAGLSGEAKVLVMQISEDIPPSISISYPLPGLNYSVNVSQLNYTYSDQNPGACWYSRDSGVTNSSSVVAGVNFTSVTSVEGNNNWTVYCNDTELNTNFTMVSFFKDTIFPTVSYGALTENDQMNFSRNWIFVNVTANDTNMQNITFALYNSTALVNSTTLAGGNRTINWTGLPNEVYTYNVSVVDRANNINTTAPRTLRLDTVPPNLVIVQPVGGTNYSFTNLSLNFTVSDNLIGVRSCWYSNNSGVTNVTITNCANTTFSAPQGTTTLRVYANDSVGNLNYTQNVTFFVDSVFPRVNFTNPTAANGTTAVGINWIFVNVSVNETNEVNITFSLFNSTRGGVNETTFPNGTRTLNWTGLDPGLYYYNVTVTDRSNNRNFTETRARTLPDLVPPEITFVFPPTDGYFYNSSLTFFNISLDENASSVRYRINGSNTNYSMSSTNNRNWNATNTSIANGNYQITVFANDSFNNLANASRNFTVDTILPGISFGIGTENDGVNVSRNWTYVNVSVIEVNEQNITFRIYNSTALVNATTFAAGTRTINWTNLPSENYFYNVSVTDRANNINTSVTRRIRLDMINPGANLTGSLNNVFLNNRTQNFTLNATDNLGLFNATLRIYNLTDGLVNLTTVNNFGSHFILGIQVVLPYDGNFTWGYEVRDSANNLNLTENRTILVDATRPNINFTDPTESNGTQREQDFIFINVSFSDVNFVNVTFNLFNNSGATLVNSTTFSDQTYEMNWSNLSSANVTYYYNVTVRDVANNFNSTETRVIKLYDATSPSLTLIDPQNRTYFANDSLALNFEVSDVNLQSCWYTINGGVNNISISGCASTTFSVPEGSNTLFLYANDSLGLTSSRNVTFVANESLAVRRSGILSYGEGTVQIPRYRIWNGTGFGPEVNASSVGGTIEWIRVANSPSREEQMVIAADSNDDVNVQMNGTLPGTTTMCWNNGTTCGGVIELTGGSTSVNRLKMDVEYETTGDDAIVVWSDNDATPQYQVWNGTGWSVNQTIPQTLISGGVISYLKLEQHPFREEIALIMSNTTRINTIIWNGSEWGCEQSSLFAVPTVDVYQHSDLAYEQVSGDLFVATSIDGVGSITRTTKPDGSCVYTSATETAPTSESEIITLGARYGSDHIMISIYDIGGTEGAQALIWNGTAIMATSTQDADSYPEASPYLLTSAAWTGTSPYGLMLYSDAAVSTNIDYDLFNISSGNWGGVANAAGLTAFSDEEIAIKSYSYIGENRSLIIVKDDSDDLYAKGYNGDTNAFFEPDGATTLEGTMASANFQSFDFEFDNDRYGPQMIVLFPNALYLNSSNVSLNISLLETAVICNYQIDGGSLVQLGGLGRSFFETVNGVSEGEHNVTFICEDVWENERSETREFIVDTTLPVVNFTAPTESNGTIIERDWIFVNVSVEEINEANITFTLRNLTSLVNSTTFSDGTRTINWTNLPGTYYYYNVTVTDLANFRNSTETRQINLTRSAPNVSLLYPTNWQNISGFLVSQFNFSVSDENSLINCSLWGNWTGTWHMNQTIVNPTRNTQLNFSSVNTLTDGIYAWNVYCYDALGVFGANATNFTFSTFLPPDAPRLLNISQTNNRGSGNITLFWNSSNHSHQYRIYNSSSVGGTFSLLNTTTNLNYTDTSFSGKTRRFYLIAGVNPQGENYSTQYFGAHVYTLRHNVNTRNWIAFPTNTTYLVDANRTLNEINNATAFTYWNSTMQKRVTCNRFSCPAAISCTPTNCNFNFTNANGLGYEVNINSSAPTAVNWSLVGFVNGQLNLSLNKNVTSFGKNWISLWANTSLGAAHQLLQNISNSDAVSRWDSSAQTSRGLIPSPFPFGPQYIGTNFTLVMEEGYEVSVRNQTNWTQR